MRKSQRGPTIIALRARREALHIAQEIAYPEIVVLPTHTDAPDVTAMRDSIAQVATDDQRERAAQEWRADHENRQWLAAVEVALVMLAVTAASMIALHLLCR
jgi:hypothetical protein